MQRILEGWLAAPKHWKAFYIAFPLSLFLLLSAAGPPFAVLMAFVWASMIAFAIWASEKLKERRRGRRDHFPPDWRR